MVVLRNWAGNVTFGARRVLRPTSVEELSEIVANSDRVHAIGSGHSFNDIADTPGDLVSLAAMPPTLTVAPERGSVRVAAGLRYGDIAPSLHASGVALANLGSLPHIGIAGACATGTHGSGVGNGGLATSIAQLEYVRADATVTVIRRGEPDFDGSVVALGALGIVTHVTLDVVATFEIAQYVYEGVSLAATCDNLDEVLASAYSVSIFTDWSRAQIWRKHIGAVDAPEHWLGARLASVDRHPIPSLAADSCTPQLGVPGPWYERLPHFKLDFTPSSGEELQSEYFVARADGAAALAAVRELGERIRPVLLVSEIRAVAADELWLSPAYGRDSIAIHFTWVPDAAAVAPVRADVERRLATFGARPHWGKVFGSDIFDRDALGGDAAALAALYPRMADFHQLVARCDPDGKLRNAYLDRVLGAG